MDAGCFEFGPGDQDSGLGGKPERVKIFNNYFQAKNLLARVGRSLVSGRIVIFLQYLCDTQFLGVVDAIGLVLEIKRYECNCEHRATRDRAGCH